MNRIEKIIMTCLLVVLIPAVLTSGQDKKSEQRIKIIVAEDGGSKVLIDTLITGESPEDSIILKGGKTIYLTRADNEGSEAADGSGQYIVTTTVTDGADSKKEVTKKVRIISSDSGMDAGSGSGKCKQAHCEELVNGKNYSYTVVSTDKEPGSDMAKYVISKDGLRITVEGSDYDRVKEVINKIEKSLDDTGKK
jgi:hypothetical protein